MKWHVLGAGSMGGLWAAHLAFAGYPVTLLMKDRIALDVYRRTPLSLQDETGPRFPRVDAELAEANGPIDWLLVTTKSFATLEALESVRHRLSPVCRILLLQNGIGVQQAVADRFLGKGVAAGVTTEGAYRRGRFQVVHAGRGYTRFGPVARFSAGDIAGLSAALERLALGVEWVDDVWPALWHKLAINSCINAPTALDSCRNGQLLDTDAGRQRIRELVDEVQTVVSAAGLGFSFPDLFEEVCDVIRATADNYSSMQQDVDRGRRTEIEHINGFLCAEGERLGVATPLNCRLTEAILELGPGADSPAL